MKVKVSKITGRKFVKVAKLSTMGITQLSSSEQFKQKMKYRMSSKELTRLLIAKHSVIQQMKFLISLHVSQRVHTHLVRHKQIGLYVATSRPDLLHKTELQQGMRFMTMTVDAKRLIEISEQRLCYKAWHETREVWEEVVKQCIALEPALKYVLNKPCVKLGYCPETNRTCGYNFNQDYYLNKKDIEGLDEN